jgi:hypothetical protein
MTGLCRWCRRRVGAYVPKGGDGSLWVARRHPANTDSGVGGRCQGSRREVDDLWEDQP